LTHVVQNAYSQGSLGGISSPSDSSEIEADAQADRLSRCTRDKGPDLARTQASYIARLVAPANNCRQGVDGAPADPAAELTRIDAEAQRMALGTSNVLTSESLFTAARERDAGSTTQVAYARRFGLPPASGAGFLNRLTGQIRPTLEIALSEEMRSLATRFQLINNTFTQNVIYNCNHGGVNVGGCVSAFPNAFAESCAGISAIHLHTAFWTGNSLQQQAAILLHEAFHMLLDQVGDTALRGSGRNFRFAECYGSFVADLYGFATNVAACPAAP
jgi:hypothetical protein